MNPESRTLLPKMAFSGFASRYREPKTEEGFQDITKVNFKVSRLSLAPCGDDANADCSFTAMSSNEHFGADTGYHSAAPFNLDPLSPTWTNNACRNVG